MPSHVLVPVDESERSDAALEFALSEYPDAKITALHVLDPAEMHRTTTLGADAGDADEFRTQQEETAEQILGDAVEAADERGRSIDVDQMAGAVVDSIVEYADERDVDHVVIGSHGRTGASRVLLGSTAEKVARRAPVPVTIVR